MPRLEELVFRDAIDIFEGLANPRPVDVYDIACIHSLLSGVAVDAGSGLTVADGQAEAGKAMKILRRAVAAGWDKAGHMRTDTDLDPIRLRPGFQLLDEGHDHAGRLVRAGTLTGRIRASSRLRHFTHIAHPWTHAHSRVRGAQ